MSKPILVPINSLGGALNNPNIQTNVVIRGIVQPSLAQGNNVENAVFGVKLSNPQLDPLESGDVSQPRVDLNFGTALVKILNVNADPYGPDTVPMVVTNGFDTNNNPILATNFV